MEKNKPNLNNKLKNQLACENWEYIYDETNNANKSSEYFLNKLTELIRDNTTQIKSKALKTKKNPWITNGLLNSIKTKNKLFKFKTQYPIQSNIIKYNSFRNKLNSLIRTTKARYFKTKIPQNKNSSKDIWNLVNEICTGP